jgi:hypothetical protein
VILRPFPLLSPPHSHLLPFISLLQITSEVLESSSQRHSHEMDHATSGHKSRNLQRYLLSSPRYWNVEEVKKSQREQQKRYAEEIQRRRQERERFDDLKGFVQERRERKEREQDREEDSGELEEQRSFFTTQDDPSCSFISPSVPQSVSMSALSMSLQSLSCLQQRTGHGPQLQEEEEQHEEQRQQETEDQIQRRESVESSFLSELTRSSFYTSSDSSLAAPSPAPPSADVVGSCSSSKSHSPSRSESLMRKKVPSRPTGHHFERSEVNKSPRKIFS